ncbi:testis-expressed protein 2 [Copidosoma floridanum]|uniref:testis-expressed protein 2 n=1 Tax=Copidosoma floridanum TaxID=29053 RepID=UPI0006C9DF63|nr:testis-expressed protein 2 [Copidosoma floridanum]
MSSKHSPAKVTLSMIKGKPITMSVPVIRYHASDDELEELYSFADDDKRSTPESEKTSPKLSPRKSRITIYDDRDSYESNLEKRSTSMDENLSEGVPPADPWRVFSGIKGKITKTFEEKLHEIKSERKKSKQDRSRDTSSVSDYEDVSDITPTEDNGSDKLEKESSPVLRKRTNSSRFSGFSYIKTGLKAKAEESVEDGVEAAELTNECQSKEDVSSFLSNTIIEGDATVSDKSTSSTGFKKNIKSYLPEILKSTSLGLTESECLFIQIKNNIYYEALMLTVVLCCCYYIPLSKYFIGVWVGIFASFMAQKIYNNICKLLTIPEKSVVPVLEILPVEEHAALEKFEGWLNELPYNYKPDNYHVARTNPVFFVLEGEVLQVFETRTRVPKRAVWNEPKLKPKFTKRRVYCLAGAKVELLPSGLIRRRRWSKKYPICVTFEKDCMKENAVVENSSDDEPQPLDGENDKIIIEEEETDEDVSQSKDARDIFEDCQDDNEEAQLKLYIFARTDRQKEDWFRRLVSASEFSSKRSSICSTKDVATPGSTQVQIGNELSKPSTPSSAASDMPSFLSYQAYISRYTELQALASDVESEAPSPAPGACPEGLWLNALLGRMLFDMHKCPETINVIQDKIQRKLSNIKLPYFMESLLVSELVIGQGAPVIHGSTKPVMDDRGLWFDLDIAYEGSLTMTIETKLNLMKLKRANSSPSNSNSYSGDIVGIEKAARPPRSPMFDSDVEDSPETSTEDEDSVSLSTTASTKDITPTQSSGKKFLNMVDKLASNKYFQHATEISCVKRAMEGVSNTEIRLMVSVSSIEGCLSVNIPPPPSDRLWYGFKPVPKINLTAKPAVGERSFNIVYVTKWIEKKLLKEFEKIVVLPNMDDLMIPMCPNYPYSS